MLRSKIQLYVLLHLLREAAEMTQLELARNLHVDRALISKIEHGDQKCDMELAREWIEYCGGKNESEGLAQGFQGLSMIADAFAYFGDKPA